MQITGKFDVNLSPLEVSAEGKHGVKLGRLSIDKTFSGELEASSWGEMLSALTGTEGSAGYVAIEQVVGTLGGRSGSFVLQHFGLMSGGEERLILEVVPGSGTGDLSGLQGSMQIIIEDGVHYYQFDFEIPDDPII